MTERSTATSSSSQNAEPAKKAKGSQAHFKPMKPSTTSDTSATATVAAITRTTTAVATRTITDITSNSTIVELEVPETGSPGPMPSTLTNDDVMRLGIGLAEKIASVQHTSPMNMPIREEDDGVTCVK